MKEIELSRGYISLIDDGDLELVSHFKWWIDLSSNTPYAVTRIGGRTISLHRFLLNPKVSIQVDHIDGNGLNNQRSNLRICTRSQNIANSKLRKDNTTGYKGVSWFVGSKHPNGVWKSKPNWTARIGVNGKRITVGYFTTKEEAAKAYNEAALKYHGEFAKLNPL